jgi:hypothetical protein
MREYDPQTKHMQHIGSYTSEEDAARAYDCAAVQAHGPGAKRNFPGETISELPVTKERKQSSSYVGVCWHKVSSSWLVQLWDPQTKRDRRIGIFATEEDAARAYDCAAVQLRGPDARRNFPGEEISEMPVPVGGERKQQSSRYFGVSWIKASSSWKASIYDPQTKRQCHIGRYASEEDAARAYDCVAVQARGPGAKRNFPGETISMLPVPLDGERKKRMTSCEVGVM